MALIKVAGGDLQKAHDAAQPFDTLDLGAFAYGTLSVRKPLTIVGNAGANLNGGTASTLEIHPTAGRTVLRGFTVQGSTTPKTGANLLVRAHDVTVEDVSSLHAACYGIRQYAADRLTLNRVYIADVAAGVEIHRCGAGSIATDVVVEHVNRMVVDSSSGNGGDAWQFFANTGPYRLIRPKVRDLRAKTVASWGWDGGAFQAYGPCQKVIVEDFEVRDAVNVCETGTDSNMGGVADGWEFRNGDVYGTDAIVPLTHERACVGWVLRANKNFLIEGNRLHGLDWWAFMLAAGGTYGGAMSGNAIRRNTVEIKPDEAEARYVVVGAGVDMAAFGSIDENVVIAVPGRNPGGIAFVTGRGKVDDLPTFRSWTPWAKGDVWRAPAPPDPCADLRRERDEALHMLGLLQTELGLTQAKIEAAKTALG